MLHTLRFSLQNAVYFIMLPFLVPVLFTFYIQVRYNLNVKFGCQKVNSSGVLSASVSCWRQNRTPSLDCVWNVMAHMQKPDFVFRQNGRVHLNRRGRQFSRLLAAEVCVSAVVMLDAPCYEVVWRVLANHSIYQFPLHFPSPASPGTITFQLDSTNNFCRTVRNLKQSDRY
jgi:hypothetical protein